MYFSDLARVSVYQVNKFHGGNHTLIRSGLPSAFDLHVVHPLRQPNGKWPTDTGSKTTLQAKVKFPLT